MTLLNLRNLVYYWVDDQQGISTGSGGYFTTVQVNAFLNNAYREVQKQLIQAGEMYYLKTAETMTVVDQADYVLPTDFLKTHRVELVLSGTGVNEQRGQINPITLNEQNLVWAQSGTPGFFTMKKDRIQLFPTPAQAQTLRLFYSYRITEMSADADIPDVPEDYHEYIAVLATLDCFVKDDRVPSNLTTKMEMYKQLMKQASENRIEDQSRKVRITTDDSFGMMY